MCKTGSRKGAFLLEKRMSNISEFYLNTARYTAVDEQGRRIDVEVDYWNSTFQLSQKNDQLETYVREQLLAKKHRVNFSEKIKKKE